MTPRPSAAVRQDASTRTDWLRTRRALLLAPILALAYPFLLEGFTASVSAVLSGSGGFDAWLAITATLMLAFAVPILALLAAMSLAAVDLPTVAQRRALHVALVAVAVPPGFVFLGVVLTMLHSPIPDTWIWVAAWAAAGVSVALADNKSQTKPTPAAVAGWPRVAHGISALCIVVLFLALHISNHLFFVEGQAGYMVIMKLFRHVYREAVVQPIVVALFLFQVASGLYLAIGRVSAPMDGFRTFQVASGVFLAFYILGHMDSVFIFARTYNGIDTDWGFATGAPAGLVKDAWNIRLVPHYGLAIFFVLAHLMSGLRVILLAHGVRRALADRTMIGGAVAAAAINSLVMLGMCGVRLSFVLPN
jgi:hypothetical protein